MTKATGKIAFRKAHSIKSPAPAPKEVTVPDGIIVLRDMDTATATGNRDGILVRAKHGAGVVRFGDVFLQAANAARGVENPMANELRCRNRNPVFIKGCFRNAPVKVTMMTDDKGHPIYMVKEADAQALVEYLRKRVQTMMRLGHEYIIA